MLHATMIVEAMRAGKHVICEKPFAGYFGRNGDKDADRQARAQSAHVRARASRRWTRPAPPSKPAASLFMYAEDWVYAPAVTKTVEILNATKDKILFMKAEESHSGSHAAHAAAVVDDRRRFADPHGMPSAFDGALSQAGRGPGARRTDRGVGGDRRRRQCRGRSAAEGPRLHQGQSGRRRRLGHADADLLGRHQEHGVLRRHDHGRRAQPRSRPTPAAARCSPTSRRTTT